MLEATQEVLDQALELYNDGAKMNAVLEATGLTYSQAWLFITDANMANKDRVKVSERTPATVRQLRDQGDSWGMIAVKFGYREFPEGKIRRMFEEASGLKSQGLRVGKGGKPLNDDLRLYKGVRRRTGVHIPKDMKRSEIAEYIAGLPDDQVEIVSNGRKPRRQTAKEKTATIKKTAPVKAGKKAAPAKPLTPAEKAAARKAQREAARAAAADDPFGDD